MNNRTWVSAHEWLRQYEAYETTELEKAYRRIREYEERDARKERQQSERRVIRCRPRILKGFQKPYPIRDSDVVLGSVTLG